MKPEQRIGLVGFAALLMTAYYGCDKPLFEQRRGFAPINSQPLSSLILEQTRGRLVVSLPSPEGARERIIGRVVAEVKKQCPGEIAQVVRAENDYAILHFAMSCHAFLR